MTYPTCQLALIEYMRDHLTTARDWYLAGGDDSVKNAISRVSHARHLIDHDIMWGVTDRMEGDYPEEYQALEALHGMFKVDASFRSKEIALKTFRDLIHFYDALVTEWAKGDSR